MTRLIEALKRIANPDPITRVCAKIALDSAIPRKKDYYRANLKKKGEGEKKSGGDKTLPSSKGVSGYALERARAQEGKGGGLVISRIPNDPKKCVRLLSSKTLREVIKDNCSLIKTVDKDLIPGIERRVKRIYEGTSTPETLQRYLEEECGLESWQAERIVKDQMLKYEKMGRLAVLKESGVRLVRWVHGGAKEPREWHLRKWDGHSGKNGGTPNGLNGYVFDIDNPPIDPETGEPIYPGSAIGCHCHLEVVE